MLSVSFGAMMRATASTPPPAALATTTRIGRVEELEPAAAATWMPAIVSSAAAVARCEEHRIGFLLPLSCQP
jgi:hypothetical protein